MFSIVLQNWHRWRHWRSVGPSFEGKAIFVAGSGLEGTVCPQSINHYGNIHGVRGQRHNCRPATDLTTWPHLWNADGAVYPKVVSRFPDRPSPLQRTTVPICAWAKLFISLQRKHLYKVGWGGLQGHGWFKNNSNGLSGGHFSHSLSPAGRTGEIMILINSSFNI